MTPIVLDNSIVLSRCLADESDPVADRAMQFVIARGTVVSGIWWYELRNALVVNERRGRLDPADGYSGNARRPSGDAHLH